MNGTRLEISADQGETWQEVPTAEEVVLRDLEDAFRRDSFDAFEYSEEYRRLRQLNLPRSKATARLRKRL